MLYLIYLEVFLKVFFDEMKLITDSFFSAFKSVPKQFDRMKKKMTFSLLKLYCETGLKFVRYHISYKKCWDSNEHHSLKSVAPLGIHIGIGASL